MDLNPSRLLVSDTPPPPPTCTCICPYHIPCMLPRPFMQASCCNGLRQGLDFNQPQVAIFGNSQSQVIAIKLLDFSLLQVSALKESTTVAYFATLTDVTLAWRQTAPSSSYAAKYYVCYMLECHVACSSVYIPVSKLHKNDDDYS